MRALDPRGESADRPMAVGISSAGRTVPAVTCGARRRALRAASPMEDARKLVSGGGDARREMRVRSIRAANLRITASVGSGNSDS
jgi:hypothetical protein